MKKYRCLITLLILALLGSSLFPIGAGSAVTNTVYISSAADLHNLARNCSYDAWSQGKTVVLTADIDLKGESFMPIPIFLGTFDGRGHKIKGLAVNNEGSNQGLFRYLAATGVIKNLQVEGRLIPGGDKSHVGGIVGHNSGLLEYSSFSGSVRGKDGVGGLVGYNATGGIVIASHFDGIIYGESKVGGIVGFNAGSVLRSYNEGQVNTNVEEYKLDFTDLTPQNVDVLRPFIEVIDIGGISGLNTGIIKSSENRGKVGYPAVGYNIGGIAGRQSGYMQGCINNEEVMGGVDVGGIVGQVEPYIIADMNPSRLKDLRRELGNLQTAIDGLVSSLGTASKAINADMASIEGNLKDTITHAESLIEKTEEFINQDIGEVNRISAIAVEALDRLVPIVDDMAKAMEIIEKALPSLRRTISYLGDAMDKMPELAAELRAIGRVLEKTLPQLESLGNSLFTVMEKLIEVIELLSSGDLTRLGEIEEILADIREKDLPILEDQLKSLLEVLQPLGPILTRLATTMGALAEDLRFALRNLEDSLRSLEKAMVILPAVMRDISDLLQFLAAQPPLDFAVTDDEFQQTKESLFASVNGLADSFFRLTDTVHRQGEVLLQSLQTVSDRMFLVLDLLTQIIEELTRGDADLDDILEDVSSTDYRGELRGKVEDCKNYAPIRGEENVGGIAGAMSFEVLKDREKEVKPTDSLSLRKVYKTRAVVIECENRGSVEGKKNYVGGIVGNAELGFVTDCVAAAAVSSLQGSYVGGIAGKSAVPVSTSSAKATLEGDYYVGGIVGLAQEISNSYALVNIERAKAYRGAIAGYADNKKLIINNFFVSDVLAGIDGISYQGKAEPVSYKYFLKMPGLPSIFKEFVLNFWAEGRLLKTSYFNYGESLDAEDIPQIPKKEGYYGRWPQFSIENLTRNFDVEAEYYPYVTILESEELRLSPLSLLLVEGKFTDEDVLEIDSSCEETDFIFIEQWRAIIPKDGNETHILRFMPPKKQRNLAIFIYDSNEWQSVKVKWDGKYMIFEAAGSPVIFALGKGKAALPGIWYFLIWLPGILALLVVVIKKERHKQLSD